MIWSLFLIVVGLITLVLGGEVLVRGASGLAVLARISPLVIGLTVVAFGTSAPELAVSVQASYMDKADLAVGNVIGSNIFNLLVVLGSSAVVAALAVSPELFRRDLWWMLGTSLFLIPFGRDGVISQWEGLALSILLLVYVGWLVRGARTPANPPPSSDAHALPKPKHNLITGVIYVAMALGGVGLLVFGSKWLTQGSVEIAQALGVSELVIGLTIVAGGTSLPELVTSILASFKGEREIAVGNVVGSNIFNVLCVLGLSALVSKAGISFSEAVFTIDLPVMLAISAACLPIFWVGRRVSRGDGLMFLCVYVVYTAFLILNAKGSPLAGQIGVIAFWGAIPLTLWAMGIKFIFPQSPPTPVGSVKD